MIREISKPVNSVHLFIENMLKGEVGGNDISSVEQIEIFPLIKVSPEFFAAFFA